MTDGGSKETLSTFARAKLVRVLGEAQGLAAYDDALASSKLSAVRTPDDLYVLAEALSHVGGMTAAVGGILSVAAVLRGASAR